MDSLQKSTDPTAHVLSKALSWTVLQSLDPQLWADILECLSEPEDNRSDDVLLRLSAFADAAYSKAYPGSSSIRLELKKLFADFQK